MNSVDSGLICSQKRLGKAGLIALITFLSVVAPLSTDMYLPALPGMTAYFSTTTTIVNFTLSGFFFFMALGILFFGAASDKYGRKPILLIGLGMYCIFSGACALATNIYMLIVFRLLEALGAGGMMAISTAIVKDAFSEQTRDKVLAIVQTMSVLGPMLAPLLGAGILSFTNWRGTFVALVIISSICIFIALMMEETLPQEERLDCNIFGTIANLGKVSTHVGFTTFLLVTAFLSAPFMAYIAICSYIYIDQFHLSSTTYSLFFAVNSFMCIFGPLLYLKSQKYFSPKKLVFVLISVSFLASILMFTIAPLSPICFFLSFVPITLMNNCLRPFSTSVLLRQHDKDAGAVSSVLNFILTIFGSFGMVIGSLGWSDYIFGLGFTIFAFTCIATLIWVIILKSNIKLATVKD